MIPNPNQGLLFDRAEYKEGDSSPDYAGPVNIDGKTVVLVGRKITGDFGDMISVQVVPWEIVHANPKFYGLTAKQAKSAELAEVEF